MTFCIKRYNGPYEKNIEALLLEITSRISHSWTYFFYGRESANQLLRFIFWFKKQTQKNQYDKTVFAVVRSIYWRKQAMTHHFDFFRFNLDWNQLISNVDYLLFFYSFFCIINCTLLWLPIFQTNKTGLSISISVILSKRKKTGTENFKVFQLKSKILHNVDPKWKKRISKSTVDITHSKLQLQSDRLRRSIHLLVPKCEVKKSIAPNVRMCLLSCGDKMSKSTILWFHYGGLHSNRSILIWRAESNCHKQYMQT